MRLIDADAVIEKQRGIMEALYGGSIETMKKHMDIDDDLSVPLHTMEGYSRAKQFFYGLKGILEAAQTVSATPVVRCRDCANFRRNAQGVCWCDEYGGAITPEDYCSRAVTDKPSRIDKKGSKNETDE